MQSINRSIISKYYITWCLFGDLTTRMAEQVSGKQLISKKVSS